MKTTNRRNFLGKGAAAAAAVTAVAAVPAKAQTAAEPTKRVIYRDGKKPAKPPQRMNSTVAYGNLIFISGVGYHKEGDIKVHTKAVLDSIKAQLEAAGSSMSKVVKCNVYLNDLKDYDAMNSVYDGSFGDEPPARTTIAAAGGIPGNSLVEIDVIAVI
ncbi:MAG TPA: RidA family protein [Bryobacteraceae bacterium]|jgi:2-iminobutanoate/2-iminopropanoate deaminase|nr:RidA family protein [Bryobacteraceae bacterium]